ncbi:hypothetical protein AB2T76_18990, partial [Clostridium butyricum]
YECQCAGCRKIYTVYSPNIGRDKMCKDCYIKSIKRDLTDQRFGKLIAKGPAHMKRGKRMVSAWVCKCDCGNETVVFTDLLLSKMTTTCGCAQREKDIPEAMRKDFISGTQISKIKSIPTKANKSGVVGVNWDKSRGKWQASLRFLGKKISLGRYEKFDDAVRARKNGEKEYFRNILESTD